MAHKRVFGRSTFCTSSTCTCFIRFLFVKAIVATRIDKSIQYQSQISAVFFEDNSQFRRTTLDSGFSRRRFALQNRCLARVGIIVFILFRATATSFPATSRSLYPLTVSFGEAPTCLVDKIFRIKCLIWETHRDEHVTYGVYNARERTGCRFEVLSYRHERRETSLADESSSRDGPGSCITQRGCPSLLTCIGTDKNAAEDRTVTYTY